MAEKKTPAKKAAAKKTTAKKAPAKKAPAKKTTAKKAPAKKAPAKKTTAKKTTAKKAPAKKAAAKKTTKKVVAISHNDIALAAYFLAEASHFSGDPIAHWLTAEAELKKSA